jgi:group I intron endonuclease
MTSGIYAITNTKNGKRYVGATCDVNYRWREHQGLLRQDKHSCKALQAEWNSDGAESFRFDVVELCAQEALEQKEQDYIAQFRANDLEYGYNGPKYSPYRPYIKKWNTEAFLQQESDWW